MSKSGWGELPPGWDRAEVGELSEIIRGVSFPSGVKTDTPKDGYVACLRTANVQRQVEWRDLWFVPSSYVKRESQIIQPDDILISTANSRELVGKVAQVTHIPHHSTLGAFISLIRFPSGLNRRLFFYELSSSAIQANIRDMASTTTNISNVSTAKLATLVLQVPPYPEQHRIAAEIEKHFTRLDAAVAALKRVRANLKRYRASVLKAACEGRLVPTEAELARAEGREYEAADVLLDRVLRERRERSEADQLAKMEAAGKPPKGDRWKAKYKEPEAPDTTGLHDLPDGWVWASLDSACLRIGDVDHKMPSSAAGGIPYVSTKDFHGSDGIDFDDAKKISQNDYDRLSRKIRPEENDLLLSRYGTVGLVRRVRVKTAFQVSYSIAILKSLGAPSIIEYLEIALQSGQLQAQMRRDIRASSQPDLGLEYIRRLSVPFAPLRELTRIVAEIRRRSSIVDALETTMERGLKRAKRLRQSILKTGFEGKLVPQDPNDEPASVLLERIRAESRQRQEE